MKKLIYTLFALVISTLAIAQPNPDDFFISGYVTDPNTGNAVSGHTVCVYADTSNQGNVVFYGCDTTNSNGYYSITVPNGSVTGPNVSYIVYTSDCNNAYLDTTVINGQGSINSAQVDFSVCSSNNLCQADFSWTYGFAGGVFFNYTGTNNASSYYWDFGDGNTSALQNPSHTYTSNGPFGVILVITTNGGCSSTAYDSVYGGVTTNCQASFTYNVTPSGVVAFSYNGTNLGGQSYLWDFGDGSTSTLANPSHFYNGFGPFVACVTMSDTFGCSSTFCDTVFFGNPTTCQANFSLQIDSSNSVYVVTLQDNSTGNGPLTYNWWVDGSNYSTSNVTHTFATPGIYGVCLSITTADSCTSYLCDTLYLGTGGSGNNCNAYFQHSLNPNGSVQFYSSGSNNQSYYWDFGDNSSSSSANPSHQYNGPGTYYVCLTVNDPSSGCSATHCDTVVVGPNTNNCQANFVAVPDSITLPPLPSNVYFFYDQSSGSPSYWHWDFGDNTTSSQQNPVHTYSSPGIYYVCLTIANLGSNCTSTYCDTVVVGNNQTGPCVASFTHSLNPNGGVYFQGYANQNAVQYQWSFGDGTSGSGQYINHVYSNPGTYTVCLTVFNNSGCQDTYCAQVSYGNNNSGYCMSGNVNAGTPNQPVDYALVYLISYDSQTNMLTAVDTTLADSSGYFSFCQIPAGQYLVKAALTPNSVYYSNYLPTYYGNSLFWDYATEVTVGGFVYPNVTINLIGGNNPGGPGFIGGDVTQGANKTNGPGDPIESVLVMLLDMNDDPIGYTYTNAQGQFSFSNLAYGTYKVYAEVPGLNTIPAVVTIDANTQQIDNIHIFQSTTELSTGIENTLDDTGLMMSDIYPNPSASEAFITIELTRQVDVTVNVYTTTGQLASSELLQLGAGSQQVEINTTGLNDGIYFVQFTESEGMFNVNKRMVLTK